jgi:hypothetical protein
VDKVETETDKDNLAIREIGLNHIKNAYKKINSESKVENPEETEKKTHSENEEESNPVDLHHAVRLIKIGFIKYYEKRDLPIYLKELIFPFIDIWEISGHALVDKYAKDLGLELKPEYICFFGGLLLAAEPLSRLRKGKLKDIFKKQFSQNKESVDKKEKTPHDSNIKNGDFKPVVIDYDLPGNLK